jgi:hypothetical protein
MTWTHDRASAGLDDARPATECVPNQPAGWQRRLARWLPLALMIAGVLIVYYPPGFLTEGTSLIGLDYLNIHIRRIRFVQQALSAGRGLPAWYPRELMGTPFWSNVHSFPLIPTRLALLWMDPDRIFGVAVSLSAVLSALFTYLYARRIGAGAAGSAVAGWTFACAGFYASRVFVGQLPLLEAYPTLPLLLWFSEVTLQSLDPLGRRAFAWRLAVLALLVTLCLFAGHPQLSIYAIGAAAIYVLWRTRLARKGWVMLLSMGLGVGVACVTLYPMWLLLHRSIRMLRLAAPENDIAFPYERFITFLFPWANGWPESIDRGVPNVPLVWGKNTAFFWDTVCYIGWLPLIALAGLLIVWIVRRKVPSRPWAFWLIMGTLALVTALPHVAHLLDRVPGIIFRSPARQIYITTFALALGLGIAIDLLLRRVHKTARGTRRLAIVLVTLAIALHVVMLYRHDRTYILSQKMKNDRSWEPAIRKIVGNGRTAIDFTIWLPFNRAFDDIGFYDAVMLSKSYAGMMDLAQAPEGSNTESAAGMWYPIRALNALGVKLIVTEKLRSDLKDLSGSPAFSVYAVPGSAERASFFAMDQLDYLPTTEIHRRLRDQSYDLRTHLMLPDSERPAEGASPSSRQAATTATPGTGPVARVRYARPDSDHITVDVDSPRPGYVYVLETWDPGWRARLDGKSVETAPGNDMFLSVRVPPGRHVLSFAYHTPGVIGGVAISLASLAALVLLAVWVGRKNGPRL